MQSNNQDPGQGGNQRGGQRGAQGGNDKQNKLKEKELENQKLKIEAIKAAYEANIKLLQERDAMLWQIIPKDFAGKIGTFRQIQLPNPTKAIQRLNAYFSAFELTISAGGDYLEILKFVADYQIWQEGEINKYKKEMQDQLLLLNSTPQPNNP
jgi:hypothetical protein